MDKYLESRDVDKYWMKIKIKDSGKYWMNMKIEVMVMIVFEAPSLT